MENAECRLLSIRHIPATYLDFSLRQEDGMCSRLFSLILLLLCLESIEKTWAFEADGQPHGSGPFSIDKHQTVEA